MKSDLIKRTLDFIIGTVCAVFFLPIFLICVAIVKFSSPGPVIYCQTRVGRYGRPFKMYKLRTMRHNAESQTGAVWACNNDPRIIPACRWMRLSHMDELPQLINVIRGDMSIVGPRPERLEILLNIDMEDRSKVIRRLDVKPGITGLAQIRSGYTVKRSSFLRKLNYDLIYIKHYSPLFDLWIIFKTFPKLHDNKAN
ncbi:MAG TPA: sugar transferase [Phycisphaerae bacterium]|nr:sugar transferase [Phycisphaerae bacterium]